MSTSNIFLVRYFTAGLLTAMLFLGGQVSLAARFAEPYSQRDNFGLYKAGHMTKAGTRLVRVFSEYRTHVSSARKTPFKPSNKFLQYDQGSILVDASTSGDGSILLNDLKKLGLQNGKYYGNVVSGMFPVAVIERAVALDSLRSISASFRPINNNGSITSQGDVALRADIARLNYGVDGTGVKVGVLSDSYDTLNGAGADIISGDLPSSGVTVLGGESSYCGTLIFCIDEGRAMLQIINDIAPGADLFFHTALGGKAGFASGITALATAGADVITDDVFYLNEPFFQDGVIAQAIDSVKAGGVAYYSAAGNQGRHSYEAPFVDSGEIFCIEFFLPLGDCDPTYERVGRMHDFDPGPGVDLYQSITIPEDATLTIAMQWDAPFGGAGPKNDHDIVLLDESGSTYFEISANDNLTTKEGWEVLQFTNAAVLGQGTAFSMIITYDDVDSIGPPATLVKTIMFGNGVTINDFPTHSGTVVGHANAAGAEAVGAAFFNDTPDFGTSPPILEPFSSAGGSPILFNTNGIALPAPVIRLKPEIVAVDGVNTTFFFNDSYGSDNIDDFFGTSAAAPHAAGVAALIKEVDPSATPDQINASLENSAFNMDVPGFDYNTGYGLIQADSAIAAVLALSGNNPPTASFTHSTSNMIATFTDTSVDSDGVVVSWNWNFGDGNSATDQNPLYTYGATGTYTAALTVTDDEGVSDTYSQSVTVTDVPITNNPPIASFTHSTSGLTATFTDISGDSDGNVVSWSWDFGDGNAAANQNPLYTYGLAGTYTVTLTVMDDGGVSDQYSQSVTVTDIPIANNPPTATFTYVCVGNDCNFDGSGSTDDGTITSYDWSGGDSLSGSGLTAIHTYSTTGDMNVMLTVIDNNGEEGTITGTISVKKGKKTSSGSFGGSGAGNAVAGGGPTETGRKCSDGKDNDRDGLTDGQDPDCQ